MGIHLQIEHILALAADPFHQKRVKYGDDIIADIVYCINLLYSGNSVNKLQVIIYLDIKGSECPDWHTARKSGCRKRYGIFGAPFDVENLGVDEENLGSQSTVESEFEALQS